MNNYNNYLESIRYWILKKELSPLISLIISFIITISWSFYLFPLSYMLGNGDFFETGDSVQHLSGWYYFKNDSWHFPLLKTNLLDPPYGINIAYTDSIPLAALFFKLIKFILSNEFNYFGIWSIFCIILQGISATWVMRLIGEKRLIPLIIINYLFITYPALSLRMQMQHTSLYTQGLIIIAFGIIIAGLKQIYSEKKSEWAFRILMIISLLIHPYFLAMISVLYLGFRGEILLRDKNFKSFNFNIFYSFFLIFLFMLFMGYFGNGNPNTSGFGYYSMNISSLFCGGSILLPNCNIDGTGGQYEGNNYLGCGVIALCVFTLFFKKTWVKEKIKSFPILFVTLILLAVYSVAKNIYIGHLIFLSLPFPDFFITKIFRSNGRFFWPIGQIILFTVFIALLKVKNQKLALSFSLVILFIQLSDLKGIINADRAFARGNDPLFIKRLKKWDPLFQNISLVRILPSASCGGDPKQVLFFQFVSSKKNKPFIGAYVAHGGINENCDSWKHLRLKEKELDILLNPQLKIGLPLELSKEVRNGQCRKFSEGLVCVKNSNSKWWQNYAPWMNKL